MPILPSKRLDPVSRRILDELQKDARLSYRELARRVGLSTPAAAERVRRLESAGVLQGYHARVDPRAAGLAVLAFIRIRLAGTETVARRLVRLCSSLPEVLECHRCTGEESFLLKVRVASVAHLEKLIDRLTQYGMTSTSLVLSSPVERHAVPLDLLPPP
ncbi:MAG: Lrp/AsnC family transcriptional regulator [Bryobacteraceae bacterium]|nr:Lrp/AsnC family transcriptional regulator [Bryobacteraceae bacterium]